MNSQLADIWKEYLEFVQRFMPKKAQMLLAEHKRKLWLLIAITAVQLVAYTTAGIYYFFLRTP